MTDNLPMIPAFEGKEIRMIEQNGDVWFPLADLWKAWGLHRNTLPSIISRYSEKYEGFATTAAHRVCASDLDMVNEQGLYLLMGQVNTKMMKSEKSAQAILRFQRWIPELVKQYRKGTLQTQLPVADPVLTSLDRHAKYRKLLIEHYDFKPDEATVITLGLVQKETGADFSPPKQPGILAQMLLAPPQEKKKDPNWLTATEIGDIIKKSAHEVNMFLYQKRDGPLLVKDEAGRFRLTEAGKAYGYEECREVTGGQFVWFIKFRKNHILELFNVAPTG